MVDPLATLFGTGARALFTRGEFAVVRGAASRLPDWMTSGPLASIEALCAAYRGPLEIARGPSREAAADPSGPSYVGSGGQTSVRGARPDMLLRLGLTVYFANLLPTIPGARTFARALEAELEIPPCVAVGAFANAPGSGLPLHHDSHHQLFVQLSGDKTILVGRNETATFPGIPHSPSWRLHPYFSSVYPEGAPSAEALMARGLETITLGPGDGLFLPAGTWHQTAGQTATCLSLVMAVRAPSVLDLLLCAAGYLGMGDPDLRAPAYGAFPRASARGQVRLPTPNIERFCQALAGLDAPTLERAFLARSLDVASPLAYPTGKFTHFLRTPSTQLTLLEADESWLSCQVRTVGAQEPSELKFHREARPLLDAILERTGLLSSALLSEHFPDYEEAEISSFLDQLAQVGALTPAPLGAL